MRGYRAQVKLASIIALRKAQNKEQTVVRRGGQSLAKRLVSKVKRLT
ncbi:MAG: hypothetical protein R2688_06100 [Fimbriimonadaceae bacterium]